MKKLISLLVFLVFTLTLSAQSIEYPRYEVDSLGQKVIVLTIEQAQKLDNNSDLLLLLEKYAQQIAEYDSICVKTVNDKQKVIDLQKVEIKTLKENLAIKDKEIENLQKRVNEYIIKEAFWTEQMKLKDETIEIKDKQIRGLKGKMIWGGVGGGVAIIGLILGLVLVN
jgi:hypothetical protein